MSAAPEKRRRQFEYKVVISGDGESGRARSTKTFWAGSDKRALLYCNSLLRRDLMPGASAVSCKATGKSRYVPVEVGRAAPRKNPARRRAHPEVEAALQAFENFTGEAPENLTAYELPVAGAGWALGPVARISYIARRDGEIAEYVHTFSEKSRPLLASSFDGSQLFILGGEFNVTDRGIVDSR